MQHARSAGLAAACLRAALEMDGAAHLSRADSALARARLSLARRDDLRADAGRLQFARGRLSALPEPTRAARGLDSLPRLRPLHRQLGGARRTARGRASPVSRALSVADVPVRPRGASALLRSARGAAPKGSGRRRRGVVSVSDLFGELHRRNPGVKPAKVLVSITAYVWTLAWVSRYVSAYRRSVRLVSWGTAVVFVGEMVCIITQATRGTTSHFNIQSPFDG